MSGTKLDHHLLACSAMSGAAMLAGLTGAAVEDAQADLYFTLDSYVISGGGSAYYAIYLEFGSYGAPEASVSYGKAYGGVDFSAAPTAELAVVLTPAGKFYVGDNPYEPSTFDFVGVAYPPGFPVFGYGYKLGYGDKVDSGSTFAGAIIAATNVYTAAGAYNQWALSDTGYIGLKMSVGPYTYYGWIGLSVGATASDVSFSGFGWDNSAGVGVLAGAVPEPTSGSLALLALGAGALGSWRRRRSA